MWFNTRHTRKLVGEKKGYCCQSPDDHSTLLNATEATLQTEAACALQTTNQIE